MIQLKPVEALDTLITASWLLDRYSSRGPKAKIPGVVVLEAKEKTRTALKKLKSDDIKNIRLDVIFGSSSLQKTRIS